MKLTTLRVSNFQCFGEGPTTITFEPTTFLIGPNGSGKTAILQGLSRMFALDPNLRRVRSSDFHVDGDDGSIAEKLWLEVDFEFPELKDASKKHPTIPSHFAHMRLVAKDAVPRVRYRLEASLDEEGEIEETFDYVVEVDADDKPVKRAQVRKEDRRSIHVHYVPAKRNPGDHISYSASSLLGHLLRAASWADETTEITNLTKQISSVLGGSDAISSFNQQLKGAWSELHKGPFFAEPKVSFETDEIGSLLRHLTISFAPGHESPSVDFSRLGDGQKSLLYISLVIAVQDLGSRVLSKKTKFWDAERLRPAVFTVIAMEEPENSLSPHYVGRVTRALTKFGENLDAQSIIATHAPALLRRIPPERVRYLRLNEDRETVVRSIEMPSEEDEGYKFVREAVQAFPELYFSRLVILGEGDSEEILLPRFLEAYDLGEDASSIVVVPLGGRHVNHFWRLLNGLQIPYLTLLDLDLARHQGGWGRVHYAAGQIQSFPPKGAKITSAQLAAVPKWNGANRLLTSNEGEKWLKWLESCGVYFSSPLDIDFAMLMSFPEAYGVDKNTSEPPDASTIKAVLGKKHEGAEQYDDKLQRLFGPYHSLFKLGSKPAAHLKALANLDNATLKASTPGQLVSLMAEIKARLANIPE